MPSRSSRSQGSFAAKKPGNIRTQIALLGILFVCVGCGRSRISGTYVAHGVDFAEMLQLTETDNGQLTGVLSSITMNSQGQITPSQVSIDGVVDGDQLTLNARVLIVKQSFPGTIHGSKIQLQILGQDSSIQTISFKRGSQSNFHEYADQVRHTADTIVLSRNLGQKSRALRQVVQNAEQWISFAELHAQRIPGVKEYYRRLEDEMQSIVSTERETFNGVSKAQMKVSATQRNVTGQQTDIQVNQMWDRTIGDSGRNLSRIFASLPQNCATGELQKYGATDNAIDVWETACQQARAERERFHPIFTRIMQQRAELKSFQVASEAHRQALLDEAWRVQ